MKSSPYDWDMIVADADGNEFLLSELGTKTILCNICWEEIAIEKYMAHHMEKHDLKVIEGRG